MSWVEIIAVVLGVINVWLTIKQRIACWPFGIAMVILYFYVFLDAKLYADMGLQGIYLILQVYGWYHWLHGGRAGGPLRVGRASRRELGGWLVLFGVGFAGVGYWMRSCTDASQPFLDAATTCLSLVAQVLLTRKKVEAWWGWICVDVLAIIKYAMSHLYWTVGLYGVFLVMAVLGLREWKKATLHAREA